MVPISAFRYCVMALVFPRYCPRRISFAARIGGDGVVMCRPALEVRLVGGADEARTDGPPDLISGVERSEPHDQPSHTFRGRARIAPCANGTRGGVAQTSGDAS